MRGWLWMLRRFGLRRTWIYWREGRRRGWMTAIESRVFLAKLEQQALAEVAAIKAHAVATQDQAASVTAMAAAVR
jgi:hypothetical protein